MELPISPSEMSPKPSERSRFVLGQSMSSELDGDRVDLLELWRAVWAGRWVVALVTMLFTGTGIGYSLFATKWYQSDVVLTAADKKALPSGLIGQLGGLTSIAGLSVGVGGAQEPIAVLRSREFARDFIEELGLVDTLLKDVGAGYGSDSKPDLRDAVTYFNKSIRTVNDDKKTGLVTLVIRWTDPDVAAEWANLLVKRLNDRMREKALGEAERNVQFLQKEMTSTNIVALQQSVGQLLQSEMQKLMLARGNEEFAFKVVDRAIPPKLRSWPRRTLICGVALVLGFSLSILGVLFGHSLRRRV